MTNKEEFHRINRCLKKKIMQLKLLPIFWDLRSGLAGLIDWWTGINRAHTPTTIPSENKWDYEITNRKSFLRINMQVQYTGCCLNKAQTYLLTVMIIYDAYVKLLQQDVEAKWLSRICVYPEPIDLHKVRKYFCKQLYITGKFHLDLLGGQVYPCQPSLLTPYP